MIELIYGSYGNGKTTSILQKISADTERGEKCFLIVPDQEALSFERLCLRALPNSAQLNLEVLGFSRLYNRVCREYGGLSYSYVTKPIRSLLMWKTLRELSPFLSEYGRVSDSALPDMMLSAVNELKASGISASALASAAKKLPDDSPLAKKLADISLIYPCFDNFVAEKYSDSSDDLSRLRDLLAEHNFFKDAKVYIDSFTSFTAVEHQIIELIFKTAKDTVVTLPLSDISKIDISEESIYRSYKKLSRSAERCGGAEVTMLNVNMRATSPALAYLSSNLWKMDVNENICPPPDYKDSIVCELCANPYAEAEAVASHILALLKSGERCRDIAIIMRDAEKYRGIIEPALQKSEIPFFFSEKSDLCSMPSVKFILTALKIKRYNWRTSDVISHIKTGLCDVDRTDADLFEEYVNTWGIRGSQFLDGEWTMNPDGFTDKLSDRGAEILEAANRVRASITAPLEKLFVLLDAADNIADCCRAIYSYTLEVSLEDKLSQLSAKAAARGDVKQARELARIYEIMLSTLADVAEAIGDEEADLEELTLILKTVFDKTDIGSIPTSIDEVTIGSASTLRASGVKYAFVMGLCEGVFPAAVNDSGVFSAGDRAALWELDIELSGDIDSRSSDELMFVQRAFATPSHKLFISSYTSKINGSQQFPSLAFNRVKELFGKSIIHNYTSDDFDYLVPAPRNAAGFWKSIDNAMVKASLAHALEDSIPYISSSLSSSAEASDCRVSAETVSRATNGSLHFSASSFEKYVRCPFNYYCSYVLALRDKKTSDFSFNNIGDFIHFLLETLLKNSIPSDPKEPLPDDELLIELSDKAVTEYVERICPPQVTESKKMQHLFSRLRALSLLLVKNIVQEFSKSEFRPTFFELNANGKNGAPGPFVFKLDNSAKVSFSGIIDRVDVYKKDGKVYLRVIDYKSGTKNFNISDLDKGINTQMLLYLFALCRSDSAEFKASLGLDNSEKPIPAGVMYLSSNIPVVNLEDYTDLKEIEKKAISSFSRSGILLAEEELLYAMNSELDATFLAGIKKDSKTERFTGAAAKNSDDFISTYQKLDAIVRKIAAEFYAGNADANPLKHNKKLPCSYCSARPVCRKADNKNSEWY